MTAFGTESSGSSSTAEHLALVDESWHGTGESELAADNTYHADSITHSESMQPLVLAGGKVAGLKAVSFPRASGTASTGLAALITNPTVLGWPSTTQAGGSPFGLRFHPILHYWRMHNGVDIGEGTHHLPVRLVIRGSTIQRR